MEFEGAQFQVVCRYAHGECFLRYFTAEIFIVGGWWLGITANDEELVRTEYLAQTNATPGTVLAWLEEFIGFELADQLVSAAKHEVESRLRVTAIAG